MLIHLHIIISQLSEKVHARRHDEWRAPCSRHRLSLVLEFVAVGGRVGGCVRKWQHQVAVLIICFTYRTYSI